MSDEKVIESILTADIGSTVTHVALIDQVEGSYRLVAHAEAPTALNEPEGDVTTGLRRAMRRLEGIAQRRLLDEGDEMISPEADSGAGVDLFVATASAAPPLRGALIGLTGDFSLDSARRACQAANLLIEQTILLSEHDRLWPQAALNALRQSPPDVIVITGGTDSGPTGILESAARVLFSLYEDIPAERRPPVVFAGNQEARRPIMHVLGGALDFRVVDNVRPSIQVESLGELQRELGQIYAQNKLPALPGFRRLRDWCGAPILATHDAYSRTLRFIARRNDLARGVLGCDVGGTATHLAVARDDLYQSVVGAALGTSYGIHHLLEQAGLASIRRWLPLKIGDEDLVGWLENARLRPQSIPQSSEDVLLTHAVVRQCLSLALGRLRDQYWRDPERIDPELTPPFDLLAVRGGALAHTRADGLIALSVLDALQPVGLSRLVVDWASLWPQLGALAQVAPLAAAQVLERDGFRELGTVVSPVGQAPEGARCLDVTLLHRDGRVSEYEIPAGTVTGIPLGLNEEATLEVRPARQFDIGLGVKGLGGKTEVRGGSLGVVVDTRGRPLRWPAADADLHARMRQWLANLGDEINRA